MRADDRRRIRERREALAYERMRRDLLVRDQRAEVQRAVELRDRTQLLDAMDRDDALRQRRLALACADDEVGASCDGTGPAGHRGEDLVDGGRGRERVDAHASSSCEAAQTRSGVIGSWRTRSPVSFAIALAIAPAVGTHGGSPIPFDPRGPAFGVSVSTHAMSICGASEAVTSL